MMADPWGIVVPTPVISIHIPYFALLMAHPVIDSLRAHLPGI
jgi:hypothetical protein